MANNNIKISDLSRADFVLISQRELSQEELSMAGGSGFKVPSVHISIKPIDVDAIAKPLLFKAAATTAKASFLGQAASNKAAATTAFINKKVDGLTSAFSKHH